MTAQTKPGPQPEAEAPRPTPPEAPPEGAKDAPAVEEGVARPPFPTRGQVDTEC